MELEVVRRKRGRVEGEGRRTEGWEEEPSRTLWVREVAAVAVAETEEEGSRSEFWESEESSRTGGC